MGFFNRLFGRNKKQEEVKEEVVLEEKIEKVEEIEKEVENKVEEVIKEEILDTHENSEEEILVENNEEVEEKEIIVENKLKPEIIEETKETKETKETQEVPEEKIEVVEKVEEKKEEKEEVKEEKSEGFFASLKEKLFRTREGLFGKIKNIFSGRTVIDEELYEELEDLLIQSDIGMDMTVKIVNALEKEVKSKGIKDPNEIYSVLKDVMSRFLIDGENNLDIRDGELNVILVVGVNGVGKTTTIGKIAKKLKNSGKKVIIGAADTFRAAAVEQLEEWGKRADVEVVKKEEGSDPGAVVYDTIQVGIDKKADVVIIDTAGRLHNKNNLMKELEKINNIIIKKLGHSRYESILVIDGTTGQNGLTQAKVFNEATKLTGFIVTKLDGTAKGGIVFSISEEIKKPIKYIGVGEKIDDLREFNTKDYIEAIFD